jgi:hypothetical protein
MLRECCWDVEDLGHVEISAQRLKTENGHLFKGP